MFWFRSSDCSPCERCGVSLSDELDECPHCKGLSNREALNLKAFRQYEMPKSTRFLRGAMLCLFGLCFVGVVYLFML